MIFQDTKIYPTKKGISRGTYLLMFTSSNMIHSNNTSDTICGHYIFLKASLILKNVTICRYTFDPTFWPDIPSLCWY